VSFADRLSAAFFHHRRLNGVHKHGENSATLTKILSGLGSGENRFSSKKPRQRALTAVPD
jgi:hypothetical protein